MKRIIFVILLGLFYSIFVSEVIAPSKKVAVYVTGQVSSANKSIINSAVIARLSGNEGYEAYERNQTFVDALNNEHDYQVSDEVLEKEIRKIGERMGVDYVIVVNVLIEDDNQCYMVARLLELTTGKIIKSVNLNRVYTGSKILSVMANNISYRLINKKSK